MKSLVLKCKNAKTDRVEILPQYGGLLFVNYFCLSNSDVKKLRIYLDEYMIYREPKKKVGRPKKRGE